MEGDKNPNNPNEQNPTGPGVGFQTVGQTLSDFTDWTGISKWSWKLTKDECTKLTKDALRERLGSDVAWFPPLKGALKSASWFESANISLRCF